jgi:hypothetical protein
VPDALAAPPALADADGGDAGGGDAGFAVTDDGVALDGFCAALSRAPGVPPAGGVD